MNKITQKYKVDMYVEILLCDKCESEMVREVEDSSNLIYYPNFLYKCPNCGNTNSLPKDYEENVYPKLSYVKSA
jgi:DNA-directed RNA polymerase subunit M/transcription elongation factor TFIIS